MSYFTSMNLLEGKSIDWDPNLWISDMPLHVDFNIQDHMDVFYWPQAIKEKYKGPNTFVHLSIKPKWKFRIRCEMMVVDEQGRLFCDAGDPFKRAGFSVVFPGGGLEKGETVLKAAIRETQEEALHTVKDAFDTGMYYAYEVPESSKQGFGYDGVASFLCVGKKGKDYHKYIKVDDRDNFVKRAQWYYPKEIKTWNKMKCHQEALKMFHQRYG